MSNKKKIIILIIVILFVVIAVIGTVFAVKYWQDNISSKKSTVETAKETADDLKAKGIEAMKNNDKTTAKELLTEAQKNYEDLGDTDKAIDAAAQLYVLEHPAKVE